MTMENRPVETTTKIADYLWWLLPAFLKRKPRDQSINGAHIDAWGIELDLARTAITSTITQMLIASAEGIYLDRWGAILDIVRLTDEVDDDYRIRLLDAYITKQMAGTIPGIIAALERMGLTVRLWEYRANSRTLLTPPTSPVERETYIVSAPQAKLWDSGNWDEGNWDAYREAQGDWADHADELAMWENSAWHFCIPKQGMIIKVLDENAPYGKLYRYSSDTGWKLWHGNSQWSHFLVQELNWTRAKSQDAILALLRKQKPAHTLPRMAGELETAKWDVEGNSFDEGEAFDSWS